MTLQRRRLDTWEGHAVEDWRRRWGLPRLRVYASLGSTNSQALRLAAHGAPAGTTLIAEHQSAGRGRRGGAWYAPPAQALLLSTIVHAQARPGQPGGAASIRAGLRVARAIHEATGLAARLKWPNDVLAPDGRKIAGVLCEGALGPGAFLVVGVGVNVLQRSDAFPPEIRASATSIAAAGAPTVNRAALAGSILAALLHGDDLGAPLAPEEISEIASRDALLGAPLTIDGLPAGLGDGVAADGALRVRAPSGTRLVYGGTVRAAPPTGASAARRRAASSPQQR